MLVNYIICNKNSINERLRDFTFFNLSATHYGYACKAKTSKMGKKEETFMKGKYAQKANFHYTVNAPPPPHLRPHFPPRPPPPAAFVYERGLETTINKLEIRYSYSDC